MANLGHRGQVESWVQAEDSQPLKARSCLALLTQEFLRSSRKQNPNDSYIPSSLSYVVCTMLAVTWSEEQDPACEGGAENTLGKRMMLLEGGRVPRKD